MWSSQTHPSPSSQGWGSRSPSPAQSCLSMCCISCFTSNLDPREPLSEGTYFPWDRSQAEPKGILQRGVSGKGFGVAPSPWQDLSSAGLSEGIVAEPRHQAGGWLGWAGLGKGLPGQTPLGMGHPQLLWATCFPRLTTLVKNFFIIANLYLPSFGLKPLPLVLSLQALVKSLSPSFLSTPFIY